MEEKWRKELEEHASSLSVGLRGWKKKYATRAAELEEQMKDTIEALHARVLNADHRIEVLKTQLHQKEVQPYDLNDITVYAYCTPGLEVSFN